MARLQTLPQSEFCALGDRLVAACARLMGSHSLVFDKQEFVARHPRKGRVLIAYFREAIRRGKLNTSSKKAA